MRPYFLPKTAEKGEFSNTFEKSTASGLVANRVRDGVFCFPGVAKGWTIVDLWGIVILLGQSLRHSKAKRIEMLDRLNCAIYRHSIIGSFCLGRFQKMMNSILSLLAGIGLKWYNLSIS